MRTFIITLDNIEFSRNNAERCRQSAKKVGYEPEIEHFEGVFAREWKKSLPKTANTYMWNLVKTTDPIAGCFASHYLLWKKCIELNEPILILEHDAKFVSNIPEDLEFDKCINFGAPSFFRADDCNFIEPKEGVQPLRDEIFFGHHAYAVKPEAAKAFVEDVEKGKRMLTRNDVYICKQHFPWLEEYYPYPVTAYERLSTVNINGLKVDHSGSNQEQTEKQIEFRKKHFPKISVEYTPNLRVFHPEMREALGIKNGKS
jgi:GR25 family glycosyltransferase involved in LPS biosynthesis